MVRGTVQYRRRYGTGDGRRDVEGMLEGTVEGTYGTGDSTVHGTF